jgi:hypothetical protein
MNKLRARNGDSGRSGHDFADHLPVRRSHGVGGARVQAGDQRGFEGCGLGEQRQRTVAAV